MVTKAFVQGMMDASPNVRPTDCVIRGHCRTHVFAFPKTQLKADAPMDPAIIVERPEARATVVSDLHAYFRDASPFRHYGICCSLRSKIDDALSRRAKSSSPDRHRLFVVAEQAMECETTMEDGTCYVVDQEMLTGGQAGEEALIAWQVDDAPWPEAVQEEPGFVTTVLAAVKVVQDETEVIREVAEASCFFDTRGRAVYPMTITMSGNLASISPQSATEVADRVARMGTLVEVFEAKQGVGDDRISNLVQALRLENIDTDHYRRAWYLSLFEAVEAVLSKNDKQAFHQRHRGYRKSIGHPTPSTTMDMDEFVRLQGDALAELRRVYLGR